MGKRRAVGPAISNQRGHELPGASGERSPVLAAKSFVVCPHPKDLDRLDVFEHLIDKTMLDIDPAGTRPCQAAKESPSLHRVAPGWCRPVSNSPTRLRVALLHWGLQPAANRGTHPRNRQQKESFLDSVPRSARECPV